MSNHYENDILVIEKFNPHKVWTAALYDADQKYPYLKRFLLEAGNRKNFLGDNPKSSLYLLTDEVYPRIEVVFGGADAFREPLIIEAEEFIGVKGFKAKGKRLTTYQVDTINELEPTRFPEEEQVPETEAPEVLEEAMPDEPDENPEDLRDEIVGQMKLFDN